MLTGAFGYVAKSGIYNEQDSFPDLTGQFRDLHGAALPVMAEEKTDSAALAMKTPSW